MFGALVGLVAIVHGKAKEIVAYGLSHSVAVVSAINGQGESQGNVERLKTLILPSTEYRGQSFVQASLK